MYLITPEMITFDLESNIFRYIIQIGSIRRKVTKNRDFMPKCCVNNFYAQAEKIDV